MLVNRSTTSPRRRLSSSGRAKFLGRISLSRLFSFSIALMASSITVPISAVCALEAITLQRAVSGTKKMPSEMYSSTSSSKPSPSSTSCWCFSSKRSEMYFKKIRPSTTDLYSDASMLPRNTHAASQICFSNPMPAVLLSAISVPPSSHALGIFCYVNSTIILRVRQFTISIFERTQQQNSCGFAFWTR